MFNKMPISKYLFKCVLGILSISNLMRISFIEVFTITNGHLKISIRCISGKYEVQGGIHPPVTLNLTKYTKTSYYQYNMPLWSLYDHSFYIYFICPMALLTTPAMRSVGMEVIILKDIVSEHFNYVEENGYLKILIGCVCWNGGRGRVANCPPIAFDY